MSGPRHSRLNPYEYHKYLINEYVLNKPGTTKLLLGRDNSNDKTDKDVVFENMKFLWNEEELPKTYEEKLAKKYYDKLFREYCITDLSRFKENKIANRFRIEKEVITGKGQFICAERSCKETNTLKTWEVNFAYLEEGEKKNALVKIRLCPLDSEKLNYHSKKREVKRLKRKSKEPRKESSRDSSSRSIDLTTTPATSNETEAQIEDEATYETPEKIYRRNPEENDDNLWKKSVEVEVKGRDEEFDDYLADLLL